MKKTVIVSAALAFIFSMVVAAFAGEGPATITLKGPAGKKEVAFNHHAHQGMMKCADCHHSKDAAGKQVAYAAGQKVESCATCHEMGKASDNMHKNCKGCHADEKKKGKNAPTGCKDCHQ